MTAESGKEKKETKPIEYISYCPVTGQTIAKFTITDGRVPVAEECHVHGYIDEETGAFIEKKVLFHHNYSIRRA